MAKQQQLIIMADDKFVTFGKGLSSEYPDARLCSRAEAMRIAKGIANTYVLGCASNVPHIQVIENYGFDNESVVWEFNKHA